MIVEVDGLHHHYNRGGAMVTVLDGLDLSVAQGEFVAVMGASGSGKSTLLHILGCLQKPVRGSYRFSGEEVVGLGERRLAELRSRHIAQVFQMFYLLPELDVVQNVALPFLYNRTAKSEARRRTLTAIRQVGLESRLTHRPAELSGGEMQRVAIARALAQQPDLILADEPTGNLDEQNTHEVLALLRRLNEQGHTIVLVTHDNAVASAAGKTLVLRQGVLHRA